MTIQRSMCGRIVHPVVVAGLVALIIPSVFAASTDTWVGGTGNNFGTTANWSYSSGSGPVASGDSLVFGGAGSTTPSNDISSLSVTNLTINSGASAYTFSGNGITLSGILSNAANNNETFSLSPGITFGPLGTAVKNTGTGTLALGALTHTSGGTVVIMTNGSVAASITTSTLDNNGIIGGWAVLDKGNSTYAWAHSGSSGVNNLTDATMTTTQATGVNLLKTSGALTAGTINSLITGGAGTGGGDVTVAAGGTLTISSGGLMMTVNNAGTGSYWIKPASGSASIMTGLASGELFLYTPNTASANNNLQITTDIVDNGGNPTILVLNGPGMFVMNSTHSYTGGTIVNGGTNQFKTATANGTDTFMGTGPVTLNAGTFHLKPAVGTSTYTIPNSVVLTGGMLWSEDGNMNLGTGSSTYTVNGTMAVMQRNWGTTAAGTSKSLILNGVLQGSGTLTMQGLGNAGEGGAIILNNGGNTFSGTVNVNGYYTANGHFTLILGNNTALQYATVNGNGTSSYLTSALQFASGITAPVLGALGGSSNIKLQDNTTVASGAGTGSSVALTVGGNNASTTNSGVLSGSGSLTKTGTGTLTLSGLNTFTGGTTVNQGTLALNAASSGTATIRSNLTINGGATVNTTVNDALGYAAGLCVTNVNIVGGTLNNSASGNQGIITTFNLMGGTMSSSGGGKFNIDNTAAINSLATNVVSTISSPVQLRANGVTISTAQGSVPSDVDLAISGVINENGGSYGLIKAGSGTLTLSGLNTFTGGTTVNLGILILGAANSGVGTIRNNLAINSGATVVTTLTDALGYTGGAAVTNINIIGGTLTNAVSGNQGIIANVFLTGGTMSSAGGAFNFGTGFGINSLASSSLSTISGNVALRGAGFTITTAQGTVPSGIDLLISGVITNSIGGDGTVTKTGPGTLVLSGANTYSGMTTNFQGTLQIGDGTTDGNIASSAGIYNNGVLVLNRTTGAGNPFTYANVISGSGSLVKTGLGKQILTGVNTYSGPTTVSNGTLVVYNSLASSAVTIMAGTALLVTNTTFSGSLTLLGNAALSMTNGSVGTLSVAALSLDDGNVLNVDLGASADSISVSGSYSKNPGTVTINISTNAGFATGTNDLILATGLNSTNGFVLGRRTIAGKLITLISNGAGKLQLVVTTQTAAWWKGDVNGVWNTTSPSYNWDTDQSSGLDAGQYPGAGLDVHFSAAGAANLATTLGADFTINNLVFDSAGSVTIGGVNSLTIGGSLTNLNGATVTFGDSMRVSAGNYSGAITNTGTLVFGSSQNQSLGGVISGSGSLVKTNSGTLTLNTNNTFTGGTTVNGGTLTLPLGGAAGAIVGTLTINSNATVNTTITDALGYTLGVCVSTVNINGGTLNNSYNGNQGYRTVFNLTGGTLSSSGGGSFNFGTGYGINSLASATQSTISASIELRENGFTLMTAQGTVPSGVDLLLSGAIWKNGGDGTVVKSGSGTLMMTGNNTFPGQLTANAGTLIQSGGTLTPSAITMQSTNVTMVISNGATVTSTADSTVGSTATNDFLLLSGAGTVWNLGNQALRCGRYSGSSDNTLVLDASGIITNVSNVYIADNGDGYRNRFVITNGASLYVRQSIYVGTSGASASNSLVVANGGTLSVSNQLVVGQNVSALNNYLLMDNGTAVLRQLTVTANNSAAITNSAILFLGAGGLTGSGTVTLGSGALLGANADFTGSAALSLGSGTVTFVAAGQDAASHDITLSGVLSGSGAVTKTGAGKLILSGVNTYSGATTVSNGTLAVNGSMASPVTVISGAVLSGTGFVSNSVSLNAGSAAISLTNGAAGTLTITGGLTLNAGNAINLDLDTPASSDKIVVSGGSVSVVSGTVTINVNALSGFGLGTYTLIQGGVADASPFALAGITAPHGQSYTLVKNGADLQLVVAYTIPPTAYWTGLGNTLWSNIANWATNKAGTLSIGQAPGDLTAVTLTASGAGNLGTVLGGDFTIDTLTFDNTGAVGIGGANSLTLSNGVTVISGAAGATISNDTTVALGNSQTWTHHGANALTVNGTISGSGKVLTLSGTGATFLNGANTYDSGTVVSNGVLAISNTNSAGPGLLTLVNGTLSNSVPMSYTNSIALANSATLGVANNLTLTGVINGNGSLTKSGAGTLSLINNLNSWTGGLTITLGSVSIASPSVDHSVAGAIGTGLVTLNSGTSLTLTNNNTVPQNGFVNYVKNNLTLDGGNTVMASDAIWHLANDNAGGLGTIALGGSVSFQAGYGGKDIYLDGQVTGSGAIALSDYQNNTSWGGPVIYFTKANNTFSGTITTSAGNQGAAVGVGANAALSHATVSVAFGTYNGQASGNNSGVRFVTGVSAPVLAGLTGGGAVCLQDGAVSSGSAVTLTVGNDNTTCGYSGVMNGTGSLIKTGTGALTLSGVNTYSGTTTVNNGTLCVNGRLYTNTVTVAANAALAGTGTVYGAVTLQTGALIDLTNGVGGTLTLTNGLTVNDNTVLNFDAGSIVDQINVTGGSYVKNTSETVTINITKLAGYVAGTNDLIVASGLTSTNGFVLATPSPTGYNWWLSADPAGKLQLVSINNIAPAVFWKGTSGTDWQTVGNWATDVSGDTPATVLPGPISVVTFTATNNASNLDTMLSDTIEINKLVINSNGLAAASIGGDKTLTLDSGIVVSNGASGMTISNTTLALGASQVWTNNNTTHALTIASEVSGVGMSLTLAGAGTNVFTGTSTYSGGTTISNGVLTLGNASDTLPDSAPVTVAGGTLNIANNDSVGPVTLASGAIAGGAGTLSGSSYDVRSGSIAGKLGGTAAMVKTTAGAVTNTSANTYSGGTAINAGTLQIATYSTKNGNELGTGAVTNNGGTLAFTSSGSAVSVTYSQNFVLNGGTISSADGKDHIGIGASTTTVLSASTIQRQWGRVTGKYLTVDSILDGTAALTLQGFDGNAGEGSSIWINNPLNTYGGTIEVKANTGLGGFAMVAGANLALQYATVNLTGIRTNTSTDDAMLFGIRFNSGVAVPVFGALAGSGNIALSNLSAVAVALTAGGNGGSTTFSGILSGPGSLNKIGAGTMALSGVNTYGGNTTVSNGVLLVANASAISNSTAVVSVNSGLQFASVTNVFNIGGLAGANTLALVDTNNAAITLWAGANGASTTNSGVISGAGALVKTGAGSLTLMNTNTYTGVTTVNQGVLRLGAANNGTGTLRGTLTINSNATVNTTVTDALGYTAGVCVTNINIVGGTLNNSVSGNQGYRANINLTGGSLSSTGGGSFNFNTNYCINSLASASLSTVSGNITLRGKGFTINTAQGSVPGGVDLKVAGNIANGDGGDGTVTKTGAGTLVLAGVNYSYTGSTIVSNGTLAVYGALASGAVTNMAGTTLLVTNTTFSGSLTLLGSASLSMTNGAAGTLTVNGLTLDNGNVLNFDLGATSDKIAMTGGTYTKNPGTVTINLMSIPGILDEGTYDLITGIGIANASGFALGAMPAGLAGRLQASAGGNLQLCVSSKTGTVYSFR